MLADEVRAQPRHHRAPPPQPPLGVPHVFQQVAHPAPRPGYSLPLPIIRPAPGSAQPELLYVSAVPGYGHAPPQQPQQPHLLPPPLHHLSYILPLPQLSAEQHMNKTFKGP